MTSAIIVFDIDGVIRDVGKSYRRAIADTVEKFTNGGYRPTMDDIDCLKSEGIWNNDWEGSRELTYRYWEKEGQERSSLNLNYQAIIDFFQSCYRGSDPNNWNGYITTEPLLVQIDYFNALSAQDITWGFFSGATRGSAEYVLKKRLGLKAPLLVAMEDAPGKPDPTGLFATVRQLEGESPSIPVLYAGDTVADMQTIIAARKGQPQRKWIGIGVLPPHVLEDSQRREAYATTLKEAGASLVLNAVKDLTAARVQQVL
ncbi:TIGR01548 family HAD-type hydrolase [Lusitaniella coriacea LEGE 07157]|uniref:TIGR01548 family HAD-type hydrolase n=1 Tax=Lusitaniella coriacea LEGE 07157 TaxID=945747 RepID=A0A8J7DU70_9CYAN|nr:TIGR01548 family HAD-type hydrolase [Lusitaniella coriacea]MBE9115236.1 TIGR01548 family HAD-type hydrolase [Lusitaniella coriacea LEGE 07157]